MLEATTAADIPLSEGDKRCCLLGKGPVVSYMDRSTVYDRKLFDLSQEIAKDNSIGWQTKHSSQAETTAAQFISAAAA